ncbi:hypothetical protein [Microseira wollei]|uniref:Uncharacterized protein n=1 Tax=Microseira wollei NIES-4236 TaxID=2530354 RepID=A0AAV3XGZ6_9CYAN|nr:hypothetical protein [Microseira wollei]GET40215.1 hypothetical protein MiSe_50230 [Microseira wollei NIES-4236]
MPTNEERYRTWVNHVRSRIAEEPRQKAWIIEKECWKLIDLAIDPIGGDEKVKRMLTVILDDSDMELLEELIAFDEGDIPKESLLVEKIKKRLISALQA